MRLSWDPGILVLFNSTADTERGASIFFHEIGSLLEKCFEGFIEFFRYRFSLLIDSIQEVSYVSTLPNHVLREIFFTSPRVV